VGGNPLSYVDSLGLAYSPEGEHGISREQAGLTSGKDDCGCFAKVLGFETAVGAGMVGAGQPTRPKPFVQKGTSSGTSMASESLSKLFRNKRLPKRVWAPTANKPLATSNKLGRVLGRWVPWVGWGLLANDYRQLMQCLLECEKDEECSANAD
jgi:hypothetical protein